MSSDPSGGTPVPDPPCLARLEGVSHRFGEILALSDVDLDVRRGEVMGLLGPNGAGKTTALSVLCGLLRPDEGRALIGGVDVGEDPVAARRQLAWVPDGAPLYAGLSARQHLSLVGELHAMEPGRAESEGRRLLEALGLDQRADSPVGTFSRGMRQKAALACALLPAPALLILDEPLSGLDAPTAGVIKAVLRGWAERGGAVLYTSHLLDVVERVCDRMVILNAGHLVAAGTLDELRARSGRDSSLEEVFRSLTRSEEPERQAELILGEARPGDAPRA